MIDDHDEPLTERWNTIATHLSRLTENRPESWWFWRARGHVQMRTGHPDLAEADYDKAIEVKPDDGWSWLGRGLARKSRGQTEPALADLTRSVALEPSVPTAWGMRGEILGGSGAGTKRRSAFDRWSALGGDPVVIPWYFHAVLRLYAGDQPGYRSGVPDDDGAVWNGQGSLRSHRWWPTPVALARLGSRHRPHRRAGRAGRPCQAARRLVDLYPRGRAAPSRAGWTRRRPSSTWRPASTRTGPAHPSIAALRELTERARLVEARREPNSAPAPKKPKLSAIDSSELQKAIRKTRAAWQYEVEAWLLGRELDAAVRFRASSRTEPRSPTANENPRGRSGLRLSSRSCRRG